MPSLITLYALIFMTNGHVGLIQEVRDFPTMQACQTIGIPKSESTPDISGQVIWISPKFKAGDQFAVSVRCVPKTSWKTLTQLVLDTDTGRLVHQ